MRMSNQGEKTELVTVVGNAPAVKYPGTVICLGGRNFIVAPLPPRRYRVVVPLLCKLLKNIGNLATALRSTPETAPSPEQTLVNLLMTLSNAFSEEMIDDLSRAYYLTLLRNYPDLTEEEWNDELPVTLMEMVQHFMLVAQMAGLMPSGGKKANQGEAGAAT